MSGLSLVFPMAGEGARFGYKFKPFLDFQGHSFIEAAFSPFRPWLGQIDKVYFVYLRSQEEAHQVSQRLGHMFSDVDFATVILDKPTPGPAETLFQVLQREQVRGPMIVCDCDHELVVDDLFRVAASQPEVACALPTWDIAGEPLTAWSVAAVDRDGLVQAIAEKQRPAEGETFRGVIGCYYFADAEAAQEIVAAQKYVYISDIVRELLRRGAVVRSLPIASARFFGDPARLQSALARPVA